MAIRNLGSTLTTSLLNNDAFNYAHLVKFEKPTVDEIDGKTSQKANTYSYLTDGAFDIIWDDGSKDAEGASNGPQNYIANKLGKIGSVTETTEAKSTSISMVLDSSALGASVTSAGVSFGTSSDYGPYIQVAAGIDLVEAGFREGDKVYISSATSGPSNNGKYVIIKNFRDNRVFTHTPVDAITNVVSSSVYTIALASEEINALVINKDTTTYTTYLNREVFINKVHLNIDTNVMIGDPYLLFKGIIAGGSLKESPGKNSQVTWVLSSHWGDFSRIAGRLTIDESHRALDGAGQPDKDAVIRPEYAGDLGFLHANQSLNVMALYNDIEISYKQVDINGGWFGGKRLREVETVVEKRTDLSFNLSPKYLPIVYGVNKIDAIPIFVDTDNTDASSIFVAYAMCEGTVAGLLDIYVDGNSSICVDKADFDIRASGGGTVELVCKGRMDRGNTLTGYAAGSGASASGILLEQSYLELGRKGGFVHNGYINANKHQNQTFTTSATAADSETGILHEKTHTITSPITGSFQFHAGKPNQKANSTLVKKATANGFKIQNDYFDGKPGEYWSDNHQLLDTAYVMGKFTIAAGETSIPELDFVVRGRGVKCFNYDRSYATTNATSSAATNFNLGDTVKLIAPSLSPTQQSASSVIIDKWTFINVDGTTETRFITDYPTSISVPHYMERTSDSSLKWYLAADDSAGDITATIAAAAKTTITSSAANSAGGFDVVVGANASFEALAVLAASLGEEGLIAFSGALRLALENGSFNGFTWDATNRKFIAVGQGNTVATLDPTITTVFIKDGILLNTSTHSAQADGYYNGQSITLKRFSATGVPKIQTRQIISYTNATNGCIVNAPWEAGFFPDVGDTYVISASKPDVRVTINPAMQLLDYLTNKRFGRGLSLDEDIDLESFKQAARDCDTRSNITVAVPGGTSISVGQKYEYKPSGVLHFQGTVASITSRIVPTFNSASPPVLVNVTYKEIEFSNVIGKLGSKFNDWETLPDNSLVWFKAASGATTLHLVGGSGYTLNAGNTITSRTLTLTGGSATISLDLVHASQNGNPLVKSFVSHNVAANTGDFIGSGYTLYDSNDIKYWKFIGWDSLAQRNVTRHQMNQVVSTSNPIFDNINLMLKQFNGILRYSNGKYQLAIKGQEPASYVLGETIEESDIIGNVSIKDNGVKKTYNSVSTSIKDPQVKFETRSVNFFNSTYLKQDKNIPKKGSYGMPGITNYFNARFNINQMLDESRYGLSVSFKMMPKGVLLQPGSLIKLNYSRFGWHDKVFRISSLITNTDCLTTINADEHNNSAYLIKNIAKPSVGVEDIGSRQVRNTPDGPTALSATTGVKGAVTLVWANSTAFDSLRSKTEVHSSSTNNVATATLLSTEDGLSKTIAKPTGVATVQYYWVRHIVEINLGNNGGRSGGQTIAIDPSQFFPATTAGITGSSIVLQDGARGPGRWSIGVSTLPASASAAATAWSNGTGDQPTLAVTDDQAWFYTGSEGSPSGQKVWIYSGSAWAAQAEPIRGDLLVNGTVTTDEMANGTILEGNINQTSAGGKFGEVVAALGTFSVVDTDVLNANSVIAREVQVFPAGATPPTISGTTLAGAGIDLKKDGDMYVGNASANKYMFWDQSAGTMTFRGALNAGDITAGSIDADRITARSITADKITVGSLTATEIATNAITAVKISANAITTVKLAADAITTDKIAANAITVTEIAANAVTADEIQVANLSSLTSNLGAVTAGTIKGDTMPDANAAPSGAEKGAFLDLTAGKMIFGNANKYIWWDGTNLTLSGVTINAAQLTGSTGFATEGYVTTAISNLVGTANANLDTLGEIATALNNDAALNATLTTAIATKLPKAGGQMTGNITFSSTQTVDGRDVSVDGAKLDTISSGATNTAVPYYTGAIAVGAGGLTQQNFTTALKNKLDAVANNATNVTNNNQLTNGANYITAGGSAASLGGVAATGYVQKTDNEALHGTDALAFSSGTLTLRKGDNTTETVSLPNTVYSVQDGQLSQNNFTNADHSKLNGIAASANNYAFPYSISQSAGNNTVVRRHGSGYIFANYFNTTPNTVTSGVTQVCVETGNDGYIRHGTAAAIRTFINVADGANNFVHPNDGVDYGSANTGATIISDVAVNGLGHVTGFTNRSLTLGNLGFTGATNANYITDNNQIANSRGYITSASDSSKLPLAGGTMTGALNMGSNNITTTGKVLFANMYASTGDLPSASTYHGMFAHVHGTGKGYFAHAGNWVELANASDAAAGTVTSVTAGAGMTQSGTSTVNPTLNVIANNGIAAAANSIGLTGNALKLHNASTVSSLSVDFLEADVIVADHISANTIEANMLTVGQTGQSSNRMLLLEDCIKIFSGTTLRVHLGNLSNNAT